MERFAVVLGADRLNEADIVAVGIDAFGIGGGEIERDIALTTAEPKRRAHRTGTIRREQDRALSGIDPDRTLDLGAIAPERPILEFDRLGLPATPHLDRAEHLVLGRRHEDAEAELEHDGIRLEILVGHDRVVRVALGRHGALEFHAVKLGEIAGQGLEPLAAALRVGAPFGVRDPHHNIGKHRRLFAKSALGVAHVLDVAAAIERRLQAELAVAGFFLGDLAVAAITPVPQRIGIERILDAGER